MEDEKGHNSLLRLATSQPAGQVFLNCCIEGEDLRLCVGNLPLQEQGF
jgi:hypothetical protein